MIAPIDDTIGYEKHTAKLKIANTGYNYDPWISKIIIKNQLKWATSTKQTKTKWAKGNHTPLHLLNE